MSIKVIDVLEPLGNFPVANSTHIQCGNETLDEVLAQKADSSSAEQAISNKADKTYVDKALSEKANADELINLSNRVVSIESSIGTQAISETNKKLLNEVLS